MREQLADLMYSLLQFTLVNHLLSRDHEALKRHLRMVKYAVIPLSHDAGMSQRVLVFRIS
jgi:hypothetical protein